MNDYSLYRKAIDFMARGHDDDKRKNNEDLALVHPLRVAAILRAAGYNDQEHQDLLIAALFHDLIEDTQITKKQIAKEFGENIAQIVDEVSKKEGEVKEDYLANIKNATKEARILKMADRIDNLLDMNIDSWDTAKKRRYAEQAKIIFESCGEVDNTLAKELKKVIDSILNP